MNLFSFPFESSRLTFGQKRTANMLAAAKAPAKPAQTTQRRRSACDCLEFNGAETGIVASSRPSSPLGTASGGKARSRAARDSGPGLGARFDCMMGILVNEHCSHRL